MEEVIKSRPLLWLSSFLVGCGFLICPTIDGLNEQGRMRQPVPSSKRIDARQRQGRNGKVDVHGSKIVGHLNGSEQQCITGLDRIRDGWDSYSLIGLKQMFDVPREQFLCFRKQMIDGWRTRRAFGKIRKRRREAGIAIAPHHCYEDRHQKLVASTPVENFC